MWPSPSAAGANCARDTAERAVRSETQLISAAPRRLLTSFFVSPTRLAAAKRLASVSAVSGVWHAAHPGWEEQEISGFSRGVRVRCPQPLFGRGDPVPPAAADHRAVPLNLNLKCFQFWVPVIFEKWSPVWTGTSGRKTRTDIYYHSCRQSLQRCDELQLKPARQLLEVRTEQMGLRLLYHVKFDDCLHF